jgi:hypothetical protein
MSTACLGRAQATAASLLLCGCERVPSINLVGAYFPSWMLCIFVGIALTLVARRVLSATGIDASIGPRALVYPALALALTLATWIVFFKE